MRNTELNTEISSQENLIEAGLNTSKKVDVNVLLNRVRAKKNSEVKKNLIITAGALGGTSASPHWQGARLSWRWVRRRLGWRNDTEPKSV